MCKHTYTTTNIQDPIQFIEWGEGQVVVEGQETQVILKNYQCSESVLSADRSILEGLPTLPVKFSLHKVSDMEEVMQRDLVCFTSSTGRTYFPSL